MRPDRLLVPGLAVLATIGVAGCTNSILDGHGFGRDLPGTRGYILISIDTLRADHLGTYGHSRDTSPFIDSLAARGAVFENAYVQLPGTLPSHMSIFTGLYPEQHGVYPPNGVLSERIKTLPEILSAHGLRTSGHTEGGYMHGSYGFARGFEEFSDESYEVECDVERTLRRGMGFLDSLGEDEGFFLFLHTYAVHDPYPDVRSPDVYHFPIKTYGKPYWPGDPPDGAVVPTGPHLTELNRRGTMPREEILDYYRAAYDAQIRWLDDLLRDFFAHVDSLGLSDEVTVIITSDHGEEFAEHGRLLHEQVYREALHVPLILVHPDLEGGLRVEDLVESIDIAPTLLELAGAEPPAPISGRSLLPLLNGDAPQEPREAFAEGVEGAERTIVRQTEDGLHQLVWHPLSLEREGGWMSRELSFDTLETQLAVDIESFHRSRHLQVIVDGEPVVDAGFELREEAGGIWVSRAVAFDPPEDRVRLTLRSFHQPRWVEIYLGREKLTLSPTVSPAEAASRPGEALIGTAPTVVELELPSGARPDLRLLADGCDTPAELGLSADRRCLSFQILKHEGIEQVRETSSPVQVAPGVRTLLLDLPGGGKKRVTFRADSCDVPAQLGLSDDPRCLSFRLSLENLWNIELFDNAGDPRQASDLSSTASNLSDSMLRALNRYRFEPVAPAESLELDPALEQRLRALGYLP